MFGTNGTSKDRTWKNRETLVDEARTEYVNGLPVVLSTPIDQFGAFRTLKMVLNPVSL